MTDNAKFELYMLTNASMAKRDLKLFKMFWFHLN